MTPLEHLHQERKPCTTTVYSHTRQELADSAWVEPMLTWEETERAQRSLE